MKHAKQMFALTLVGLLLVGAASCRKPPSQQTSESAAYDPKADPLVNPPSLFDPAPADPSQVATDETLYLQLNGSPSTLNPIFVSSTYDFLAVESIFGGLFSFDREMKWKPNEDFLESYEESADHTTFIAKIKPGLTWQDGHPFTAHDVVFSWQQILDERVPALTVKQGTEEIKECVAVDDLTVKFVQPKPQATSKWNVLFPIIPKHLYEKGKEAHPDLKTGEYYTKLNRNPVGSGPYKLVEWKENDVLILERWDGYKGRKPMFKRVVFRIIPDANASLLSFEKGEVDVIEQLTAQQFAHETNTPTFAKVGYKGMAPQWDFTYVGWNMDGSNPFFADKRVRHAMTHAMNIPLFIEKIAYNLHTQCLGIFHPDSWMFNKEVKPLDYSLEKAAQLLDEAGWRLGPADGWRYKEIDGRKVAFDFEMLIPQGSEAGRKLASIFQEDLKKIGVRLSTRILEWSAYMDRVQKNEFQSSTAAWGTGTDPDTSSNLWKSSEYKVGRNYVGYSNAEVDELFEKGKTEFDPQKRAEIYQRIHKLIYDDQPYTFVVNRATLSAFNKRLRGVQFSPRGIYNFDPSYNAWWVARP